MYSSNDNTNDTINLNDPRNKKHHCHHKEEHSEKMPHIQYPMMHHHMMCPQAMPYFQNPMMSPMMQSPMMSPMMHNPYMMMPQHMMHCGMSRDEVDPEIEETDLYRSHSRRNFPRHHHHHYHHHHYHFYNPWWMYR